MKPAHALPLAALLLAVTSCAPVVPVPKLGEHDATEEVKPVPFAPPAGKVQVIPTPPADMKNPVWIDGEWQWKSRRWVWVAGGWQPNRPSATYAHGTVVYLPDGKLGFIAGTWKEPSAAAK